MSPVSLIGLAAAVLTTIAFLPQSVKTIRTGRTEGVSVIMYVLFVCGVISWIGYGALVGDLAVLAANIATLIFALPILWTVVRNSRRSAQ